MPVLVTGAGGFLGTAVVRALLDRGADVRALVGPPGCGLSSPAPRTAYGDIEDTALVGELVDGVACVVHLAGPPSVAHSFSAPAHHLRVHGAGTAAVLERCAAAGVPHLVYVSSAEVYGAAGSEPVAEDHPRAPRSPYGIAKLAAELLLERCAAERGVRASILRPFSLYGADVAPRSLLGTILDAALRGEPPTLADLRPVRDYCFVADAARAVAACIVRAGPPLRAYNVASGRGVSVAALARAVLRAAGRPDLELRTAEADRPGGALTLSLIGDPARARDELGFTADTTLEAGLILTLRARAARPDPTEARWQIESS
jgi:nucleoside-diphosphate-sugar epimerase